MTADSTDDASAGHPDSPAERAEISVTDFPARQRFEARTAEGEVVGLASYERHGDVVRFTHTEVDDAYEGQGVGSRLARVGLDQVRVEGLSADPRCPYVASWIERHPDYADLVT